MWTPEHREKYKDSGGRYPTDLTDGQWEMIAPFFSVYHTFTASLREMVNGCLYHEKTGCQWRFMPRSFGAPGTVRYWHDRFRRDGLWADISALLIRAARQLEGGVDHGLGFGHDLCAACHTPEVMARVAVIAFDGDGMFLANSMAFWRQDFGKSVPITGEELAIR